MYQVDKILAVIPRSENEPNLLGFSLSSSGKRLAELPEVGCVEDRIKDIPSEQQRPSFDGNLNRKLVVNAIFAETEFRSPSLIQMFIRRSSVVFAVIPGSGRSTYARYASMMLPKVIHSYNRIFPNVGPAVKLHFVFLNDDPESITSFVRRVNRFSRQDSFADSLKRNSEIDVLEADQYVVFSEDEEDDNLEESLDFNTNAIEISYSVILSSDDPDCESRCTGFEEISCFPKNSSVEDIYVHFYQDSESHWRKLPLVRNTWAGNRLFKDFSIELFKEIHAENQSIIHVKDLYERLNNLMSSANSPLSSYHFYLWMDAFDKEGLVRYYHLNGEVHLDFKNYLSVSTHILKRLGELSSKRSRVDTNDQQTAVFNIAELASNGPAEKYLASLPGNQRDRIIESVFEELVESEVAHEAVYRQQKYILNKKATPLGGLLINNFQQAFRKNNQRAIRNIMAGIYSEKYRIIESRLLCFSLPNDVSVLMIPVEENNDVMILSLYSTGQDRKLYNYYKAIYESDISDDEIIKFWNSKKQPDFLGGIQDSFIVVGKQLDNFNKMRKYVDSVNGIVSEAARSANTKAKIYWTCVDDILKPVKVTNIEKIRTTGREWAVRAGCLMSKDMCGSAEDFYDMNGMFKVFLERESKVKRRSMELQEMRLKSGA